MNPSVHYWLVMGSCLLIASLSARAEGEKGLSSSITLNEEFVNAEEFQVSDESACFWTSVELPHVTVIHDIHFDGARFLLAGWNNESGYILSTENGTEFETVFSSEKRIWSVAGKEGQYVATGSDGYIVTSPDGNLWTEQPSGVEYNLIKVIAGGDRLIALSLDGRSILSDNGSDWFASTAWHPRFISGGFYAGQFIGFGGEAEDGGGINTKGISLSTDGDKWDRLVFGSDNLWEGIVSHGSSVLAVGFGGAMATTSNLEEWTPIDNGTETDLFTAVKSEDCWIAGGKGGVIITSADGKNWIQSSSPVNFNLLASANGNGTTVLGGIGDRLVLSDENPNFGSITLSHASIDLPAVQMGQSEIAVIEIANTGTTLFEQIDLRLVGEDSEQFSLSPQFVENLGVEEMVEIEIK